MSSRTAMLITDIALITASFIMFQKIANVLSILSFLMVASMTATGVVGYRYVTSEQFKARVMNEILGNVKGMLPNVMDNTLPKTTGPSMALPKIKLWTVGTVKLNWSGVEIKALMRTVYLICKMIIQWLPIFLVLNVILI